MKKEKEITNKREGKFSRYTVGQIMSVFSATVATQQCNSHKILK